MAEAQLIAVSADHSVVAVVAERILGGSKQREESADVVIQAADGGTNHALRLIRDEAQGNEGKVGASHAAR